ncbi:cdc42 effector protein 3 [Chanos chanos]|uniref:Cdc42 effector protein 3 n=1 Tax=Chanos chanos TaxID=29144 RepID=A0A6J2V756_CHACN|nr:cdc42 effector protein 3-like [Chanos chanos]
MPAKTPIYLKSTNTKKGKKCRLRDILSPDMISPPLGDFRHTIHIGKGGERDAFGDMSFLQGRFELLPGKGEVIRPSYTGHGEFLRANSASDASYVETPSPVLKNAISLPTIGGSQALTLPLISTTVFPVSQDPLEDLTGPPTPPASSETEEEEELEILQMDALLQSISLFGHDLCPPSNEVPKKSPFTISFDETPEKPPTQKAFTKNHKVHNGENGTEKPLPFHAAENRNGMCNGDISVQKPSSYSINGTENTKCNENGVERPSSYYISENRKCNGYNNHDSMTLPNEKEQRSISGDSADRDSGVDEGRICDFDFELSKPESFSEESLSQITGSLLSLELDLGPSILDDILNIMDKPKH